MMIDRTPIHIKYLDKEKNIITFNYIKNDIIKFYYHSQGSEMGISSEYPKFWFMKFGNKFNLFDLVKQGDFGYIIEEIENNSAIIRVVKDASAEQEFFDNSHFEKNNNELWVRKSPRNVYLNTIFHTICPSQIKTGFDQMTDEEFEIYLGFSIAKHREQQINNLK